MAPGVTRGLDALESVTPDLNLISFTEKGQVIQGAPGVVPAARMPADGRPHVGFRKPVQPGGGLQLLPLMGILNDFSIGVVEVDL